MKKRLWIALVALPALVACQQSWVYEAERNEQLMAAHKVTRVHYDVPPQVVYQIDDHRFITVENYNSCYGDTWYNDTKQGVRTNVGETWVNGFLGKLVIDDPTGMNVVIPTASTNLCGDRGCMSYFAYSTDGGRTFNWLQYDRDNISFDSVEASKSYTFSVTGDSLYVTVQSGNYGDALTDRYPLGPGYVYGRDPKLPEAVRIEFNATLPPGLHTPTGQDHYICDASIHDPKVLKR